MSSSTDYPTAAFTHGTTTSLLQMCTPTPIELLAPPLTAQAHAWELPLVIDVIDAVVCDKLKHVHDDAWAPDSIKQVLAPERPSSQGSRSGLQPRPGRCCPAGIPCWCRTHDGPSCE